MQSLGQLMLSSAVTRSTWTLDRNRCARPYFNCLPRRTAGGMVGEVTVRFCPRPLPPLRRRRMFRQTWASGPILAPRCLALRGAELGFRPSHEGEFIADAGRRAAFLWDIQFRGQGPTESLG
jgi:hypothetical protein